MTRLTSTVSFRQCKSISIESFSAFFTFSIITISGIINTFQTCSCQAVTVTNRVGVNIAITITSLTSVWCGKMKSFFIIWYWPFLEFVRIPNIEVWWGNGWVSKGFEGGMVEYSRGFVWEWLNTQGVWRGNGWVFKGFSLGMVGYPGGLVGEWLGTQGLWNNLKNTQIILDGYLWKLVWMYCTVLLRINAPGVY